MHLHGADAPAIDLHHDDRRAIATSTCRATT
jgi:hypothetical protein